MATIRQNTPNVMAAFAVMPEFFHSPNKVPHAALAITSPDMNTGHPMTGPSTPIFSTPQPYMTILPSHKQPKTPNTAHSKTARPMDRRIGGSAKRIGRRVPPAAEQPRATAAPTATPTSGKDMPSNNTPAPHKTPITPMTAREVHGVVLYAWMG